MRHITQNGLDLIKRFEGLSWTVYFCPARYPTIGYGHVVKDNEDFSSGINEVKGEEHGEVPDQFMRWVLGGWS